MKFSATAKSWATALESAPTMFSLKCFHRFFFFTVGYNVYLAKYFLQCLTIKLCTFCDVKYVNSSFKRRVIFTVWGLYTLFMSMHFKVTFPPSSLFISRRDCSNCLHVGWVKWTETVGRNCHVCSQWLMQITVLGPMSTLSQYSTKGPEVITTLHPISQQATDWTNYITPTKRILFLPWRKEYLCSVQRICFVYRF